MASKKIQLYTDRANTIEASPETSANCVILSDGNDLQKVLDNDLTTPTVVHEETSFKVGVGDVNVSSSVVDGEVGRMVIKGKTYQNILPEPSTPVLTNNKEMFKVNEGLDPNVEVVDGISKSAILSGQTLVNLSGQLTHHEKWVETGDDLVLNLPSGNGQPHINVGLVYKLKKDTIYTVVINMKLYETGYPHICFMDESNRQLASDREWTPSTTGVLKTKFTTSSTVEAAILRIIPRNGIDNIYTINKNIIVLEGDYTNVDIPHYFEGMQSVKMPVLCTTGKNLFNFNANNVKVGNGSYVISNNNITITQTGNTTSGCYVAFPCHLKAGTTYTYHATFENPQNNNIYIRVSHGDGNDYGQWYSNTTTDSEGSASLTLTCKNDGCHYLYVYNKVYDTAVNIGSVVTWSNIQFEEGSVATSYEPHKTNILHTPEEVVLRSLPNGVCDTLNLNTGEYVQRIGEVVLDGSQSLVLGGQDSKKVVQFIWASTDVAKNTNDEVKVRANYLSAYVPSEVIDQSIEGICTRRNDNQGLYIALSKTKVATRDINLVKEYLQANPITAYYELATPVVKTVDLSTSGNWEKIVLDGSEKWTNCTDLGNGYYRFQRGLGIFNNPYKDANNMGRGFSDTVRWDANWTDQSEGFYYDSVLVFRIHHSKLPSLSNEGFEQFLSQNPITVWYQTATHQESTQVKQPIFFADGHIIQSSGADNSLIPTLDYQVKTSNSYVMDLMKTNTRYTMKAKSASGTFTIDGTSYGAGTNGTFTTPTSMTNKLLVMSNKTNEEVMIIEGDVVSKAIPYFKGIKSAFEDESKIEVLSTGKNLFDGELEMATIGTSAGEKRPSTSHVCSVNFIKVKPSSAVILTNNNGYIGVIHEYDKNYNYIKYTSSATEITKTTLTADTEYVLIRTTDASKATDLSTKFLLEVANSKTDYEPHKSNNTKIPLLSPLRSLPNGVCDELIIDRMKKKATLIQRVGVDIYNGSETWSCYNESSSKTVEGYCHTVQNLGGGAGNTNLLSNSFRANYRSIHNRDEEGVGSQQDATYSNVRICISRTKLFPLGYTVGQNQVAYFQKWLQSNPVTVLYPLLTPVVTEIDLESFPLVYKDGHIFLNSEIAPVVEIDYNINQSQQIQSNNETLQRHELDILDLDNLIVSFVNAEYNLRLLKFDMEMSMMALAE